MSLEWNTHSLKAENLIATVYMYIVMGGAYF